MTDPVTLDTLNNKLDKLQNEITSDQLSVNAHPVLFITLLVLFFITMDFWAKAIQYTLHELHPRGYLVYWEYIIIAIVSLALLLLLGHMSGIRIRLLEE